MTGYEALVAEAVAVPLRGWDFSWIAGRAEGSEPSWSYPALARGLIAGAGSLLDVDTGGGELLASLAPLPPRTVAIEGWAPNVAVARERLGIDVRYAPDNGLPVDDGAFEVVLNRHGRLDAAETARVLTDGGWLLTQQVGSDDCAELNAALGAPPAYERVWNAAVATEALRIAGLQIIDVREEWPVLTFRDVGALVYQLRAVPWQVPDFSTERYEAALRRIHRAGSLRVRAHRFLVRARKGVEAGAHIQGAEPAV